MKAANIAPCMNRRFAGTEFGFIDKAVWKKAFEEAKAAVKKDCSFEFQGSDIDPAAVKLTLENAQKAGVDKFLKVSQRDIRDFHYPFDGVKIITNPPYAERMGELSEAKEIYRTMGKVMLPRENSPIYVITSIEEFEDLFGEKASKNRKLYNGMIMCRLYIYN
jgi:putative N6-adenine-specific DNA methylase